MSILQDTDFQASDLRKMLAEEPLHFIDIGARGGVQDFVAPMASLSAVLAFEPDPAGLEELQSALALNWGRYAVECMGVGGHNGPAKLNLYAHGVNHSLLKANEDFRLRYGVKSLESRGAADIEIRTLDDVLFNTRAAEPHWGELLKIDVQGAEIEQFLRARGFTFYGFKYVQGWSQKFIEKRQARGAERLCFGDAIFLRDPLPGSNGGGAQLSPRQQRILYLCALLFRFYDFAIEMAASIETDEAEAGRLFRLAERLAGYPAGDAVADVEALLARMKAKPGDANLELVRFIEERRYEFDVSDAALARRKPAPAKPGQ